MDRYFACPTTNALVVVRFCEAVGVGRSSRKYLVRSTRCVLGTIAQRPFTTEAVSKLKITGFQGVALPLPRCREAGVERSDKPNFALSQSGVRFDTAWTQKSHSPCCEADVRNFCKNEESRELVISSQ